MVKKEIRVKSVFQVNILHNFKFNLNKYNILHLKIPITMDSILVYNELIILILGEPGYPGSKGDKGDRGYPGK